MDSIFGATVFYPLIKKIQDDYVGAEMTVAELLADRPAIFEQAFLDIKGLGLVGAYLHLCGRLRSMNLNCTPTTIRLMLQILKEKA